MRGKRVDVSTPHESRCKICGQVIRFNIMKGKFTKCKCDRKDGKTRIEALEDTPISTELPPNMARFNDRMSA